MKTTKWNDEVSSMSELLPVLPSHAQTDAMDKRIVTTAVKEEARAWLQEFSGSRKVASPVILQAVFSLLLHRYSSKEDILLPVIVNKERDRSVRSEVLLIRTQFDETNSFEDFLRKVNESFKAGLDHGVDSFSSLIEQSNPNETAVNSLFGITCSYTFVDQANCIPAPQSPVQDDSHHLAFEVIVSRKSMVLHAKYDPRTYSDEMIKRVTDSYVVLMDGIRQNASLLVSEYPILSTEEKHKILSVFNDTKANYPEEQCVHHFFMEKARISPHAKAVVYGDKMLSYGELYDRCADLAVLLQSRGVKPDTVVGLFMDRSLGMMIGVQGILMAGGAYLPMEPEYPDDRLSYILDDSRISVIVCQLKWKERLDLLTKGKITIVTVEDNEESGNRKSSAEDRKVSFQNTVAPHHLAYVIYTSGSTGNPKGVMVEHRALMNRIYWMQQMYRLEEKDIVLQKTPFTFDVSVWEFVWPMMSGASVVLAKPGGHKDVAYLEELINREKVTTLHFVPSMFHSFLDNKRQGCKSVKRIFCSGEALDAKSVETYQACFPDAALHNLYGPTEAAIDVTYFDCAGLRTPFVPIGKPISNIQIYILDKHQHLLPIGVAGELYISGDGLARGYLNKETLSREKFVRDTFDSGDKMMYRSGDLARWMEDGNIEYLGRIDHQVKIRGVRIELGEIEAKLASHPAVKTCCVIVSGKDIEKKLIAFYVATDTEAGKTVKLPFGELSAFLSKSLPDYMIPSAFISLEAFPVTSNGKLNRKALEEMDIVMKSEQDFLAPRDPVEEKLAFIWSELLGVQKIGVNDSFFELGGHSLLIIKLIARLKSGFSVDLPLETFFNYYTIAEIAEIIKRVDRGNDGGDSDHAAFEEFVF